jgi:glycosyltransferase involved in cell wall biosynthesis
MHTVLMIAFHYPPVQGSSGVQRTLRFSQHLSKFGWEPIVLTVTPGAYEATAEAEGNEVPSGVTVERAFGLDTTRHLALFGRYPRRFALPDRWATWKPFAIAKALTVLKARHVDVVWSTFPIATAHAIALEVSVRSGLPWIAEFRDPLWQGDYPPDPRVNRSWRQLEHEIFERAERVVVTTPSAADLYAERYPAYRRERIQLIENGYDEETFDRATAVTQNSGIRDGARRPVTLLHSGVVYPSERDPTCLFRAVASLKRLGRVTAESFQVVLRASGHDSLYRDELARLDIRDIVRLEPGLDYLRALQEMLAADGLLILQAANCNAQVPAKLYEYLRAARPIVALTDPAGDTARTLRATGAAIIAPLDSDIEIEKALMRFIRQVDEHSWQPPPMDVVRRYSRKEQTGQLAALLGDVLPGRRN